MSAGRLTTSTTPASAPATTPSASSAPASSAATVAPAPSASPTQGDGNDTPRGAVRGALGHGALVGVALSTAGIALGHLRHHEHVPGAPMPAGPLAALPHVHRPDHVVLVWVLLASYVVAVACGRAIRPAVAFATVVVLVALLALTPPRPLTDLFSYVAYGRMLGLDGIDPYRHGPAAILADPSFAYVSPDWHHAPTVYGPAFTGLTAGLASLGTLGAAWALKAVAGVAAIVTAGLCALAARRTDPRPGSASAALVLVGLNPLLLAYGVGGGHNDVLMLVPAAGGLWLLARRADAPGAALVALGPAIKLSSGLALPFLLVGERRWRVLIGVVAGLALLAGGTLLAFGTGPIHVTGLIGTHTADGHRHSVPAFVAGLLGAGVPSDATFRALTVVAGVGTAAALAAVGAGALRWTTGAVAATALVVLTAGTSFAWYGVWVLALAGADPRRGSRVAVLLLTTVLVAMQLVRTRAG